MEHEKAPFPLWQDSCEEAAWKVPAPIPSVEGLPLHPADLGLPLQNEGWFALKGPHIASEYGDSLAKYVKGCTQQNRRIEGMAVIS